MVCEFNDPCQYSCTPLIVMASSVMHRPVVQVMGSAAMEKMNSTVRGIVERSASPRGAVRKWQCADSVRPK